MAIGDSRADPARRIPWGLVRSENTEYEGHGYSRSLSKAVLNSWANFIFAVTPEAPETLRRSWEGCVDRTSGGADLPSKGRSHTLSDDTQSRVPPFEYRKS